ncbi:MAG: hypothetical protein DWP94_01050 [Flavobacterium sp.]|nr:MAG: hypothetical protein DWP94_01050 [Flavobacterium sp.]
MKNSRTILMTHSGRRHRSNKIRTIYNNMLAEFKRGEIGYAAIAILGQSCLGSIAVILLLMNDMPTVIKMVQLFLVTVFCMAFNGAVLAQLKSKITFDLLIATILLSTCVIITNLV